MRILLVNKYLFEKGGAETYVIKLGERLKELGHEVQYFGMADERNIVGNNIGAYTENIDFHNSSLKCITYPFKIIYSRDAERLIKKVTEDFRPDVVHLNNFNYQLTPSVIYAVKKYNIPIVYTAHDAQLVCPNHKMRNDKTEGLCRKCDGGLFLPCIKNKCVHSSSLRSVIGAAESCLYRYRHTYRLIDKVICPSKFMENELLRNPDFAGKTMTIYNFIEEITPTDAERGDYVLYFGRYSQEKGIRTLVNAARHLPDVKFVFAGRGEMKNEIKADNIEDVGFKTGDELRNLIEKAAFTVLPAEWSENCPFSVMESQTLRTPVIGAAIGGIPELIDDQRTGLLFESGNTDDLVEKIEYLYTHEDVRRRMSEYCRELSYDTVSEYSEKMISLYKGLIM